MAVAAAIHAPVNCLPVYQEIAFEENFIMREVANSIPASVDREEVETEVSAEVSRPSNEVSNSAWR